ncbi:unnamed protein product [Heterobilharzia americana]|nr:unnamed protein product [Heterobilharzia americana]
MKRAVYALVMDESHEKFFTDVYSVLKQWEFIILCIQTLLLWKRVLPSLIFTSLVHIVFLLSTLFIFCLVLFLILFCNLLNPLVAKTLNVSKTSSGSFSELVSLCQQNGNIMSTVELSRWISRGIYSACTIVNKLAPCRRNHPLSFFIISSTISIGCILLSVYVSGLTLAYVALNICLTLPTLIHHNVISRVWNLIRPVLLRIEAEFDKNPLESPEEREAGERELYEPIVAAANAANSAVFPGGILMDEIVESEPNQLETEELDNSEAVFIKQFVSDISAEELDRLFSEALGEHENVSRNSKHLKSDFTDSPGFNDDIYPPIKRESHSPASWAMGSEYATDDDESSDIMGEVCPSLITPNKETEHEGFIFIRKQE